MTDLTRRRLNERFESWGIFYGDVKVGGLSKDIGLGSSVIWRWCCGFYPGCEPHQQSAGSENHFAEAKAAFQQSWDQLQPQLTSPMMDEWRKEHAFTKWKYAMQDAGHPLSTATSTGRSRCFCGAAITLASFTDHVYAKHAGTKQAASA